MNDSGRGYPDNHNHYLMAGDIGAMAAAAERAGLSDIVFSEHNFHVDEAREAIPYLAARWTPEGPPVPLATYVDAVHDIAERSPVNVLLGLEVDVRPEDPAFEAASDAITALRDDWDVVLGSVHTMSDDVSVQDEHVVLSPEEAWQDYHARLRVAAASGRFDIISHPIRLGFSVPGIPACVPDLLSQLAVLAGEHGVALEVNGSDLRRRPDLVQVLVDVLARHDAPISLGSDAHLPGAVGFVRGAVPLLRDRGVTRIAHIQKRTLELVPLPAG